MSKVRKRRNQKANEGEMKDIKKDHKYIDRDKRNNVE